MKKIILGLILLISLSAFADIIQYSNKNGCFVEMEQRRNGIILYITKGDQEEIVGYGNNYSFGDFAYCADQETKINIFEATQATDITIGCSAHRNGHKTTRGKAIIRLMNGDLNQITIDGQVKGFFGWKQDSKFKCLNLIKK